jgi:hypothetical protein
MGETGVRPNLVYGAKLSKRAMHEEAGQGEVEARDGFDKAAKEATS